MKKFASLLVIASLSALTGCSTYSAARYTSSPDNVVALRALNGKVVNIGGFSSAKPGERDIMCRGVGPIKTPDGEPFSEFVKKALVDELKLANIYSQSAPVTLTGHLNAIDFSSATGRWNLGLTIKSSNGKSMVVSEQYPFSTSLSGETACNQTAHALMPAVQNLVGKVVRASEFGSLLN